MLLSPVSFANTTTKQVHAPIAFQIIQDQMNIDRSMIKDATLVTNNDGSYGGLKIELKSSVAKKLTQMTKKRVGKFANLVLNDKVIITAKLVEPFSPDKFIVNGGSLTKEEAVSFIDSLKNS